MQTYETIITIEDKTFQDKDGKDVAYTDMRISLFGGEFRVSIKKEDKSLFEYLRKLNG